MLTSGETVPKMDKPLYKPFVNKVKSHTLITTKEFLDFLKTAYQTTDSSEEALSSIEGAAEIVDWIKLKNTEFVQPRSISCQTSHSDVGDCFKSPDGSSDSSLRDKLDEVLNEGLLDSVLPYMIPIDAQRKSSTKISEKGSNSGTATRSSSKLERRKPSDGNVKPSNRTNSEIEIHVCDEVKNVKRDFFCNQKLLVDKMGYFAEITAGQKLEDMDISVHCDIGIFEWLMQWVKREPESEETWPQLDHQNVIPILVSATFLQMEPLIQDCLLYCHENMNDIIQNAANLSCVNDNIINRLSAMYTNSELESIKDKRDKIQSRLYCKMIASLCEPVCESVRGHWNSLSKIFRCSKCEQLVMPEVADVLPCRPSQMYIDRYGRIMSNHVRDPRWNINEYVMTLQSKLKSWRKVYWHLWGDCHFLYCAVCEKPFPCHKLRWCCYHPDYPQFFTIDSQKSPLPVGRYPCCGERAYKFQTLNNYSGCHFREHAPLRSKARDAAVCSILDNFRDVIDIEPPQLIFPERLTRLVARASSAANGKFTCKETFWWDGIQLLQQPQHCGLLGQATGKPLSRKPSPTTDDNRGDDSSDDPSSSSSGSTTGDERSEESPHPKTPKSPTAKKRLVKKKIEGRLWQSNLSARSNQDLQRSYEETVIHKMVDHLTKAASCEPHAKHKGWMRHLTPPGGIYTRLEAEWKENHSLQGPLKRIFNYKPKIKATKLV